MSDWFYILLIVCFIKSTIIGSDFNFVHWIRYGSRYWYWYMNRERFEP
jgi:hypothetical protein